MNHFFFFKCRDSVLTRRCPPSVTQTPHQIVILWAMTKNRSLDRRKKKVVGFCGKKSQEMRAGQPCGWNPKAGSGWEGAGCRASLLKDISPTPEGG